MKEKKEIKFPDLPYLDEEQRKDYEVFFEHYLSCYDIKEDPYLYQKVFIRFFALDPRFSHLSEYEKDDLRYKFVQALISFYKENDVTLEYEEIIKGEHDYQATKGLKLKEAAAREGITISQLASMVRTSRQTMYKWINGQAQVPLSKLLMLSVILKEEVTNLLKFENNNVKQRVDGSVQIFDLSKNKRTEEVFRLRDGVLEGLPLVALRFPTGITALGLSGDVTLIVTDEEKYLPLLKKETWLVLNNDNDGKYFQLVIPGRIDKRTKKLRTLLFKYRSGRYEEKKIQDVQSVLSYIVLKQIIS